MKSVRDFQVKGKRVLVRCDFNVPVGDRGVIQDDFRIRSTLPTIQYLLTEGARVILMGHFGRPDGKVVEELRVDKIAARFEKLLSRRLRKLDDCVGSGVQAAVSQMQNGDIVVLENLRFHKEEEENNEEFAKALAELGDVYLNDAFGTAHREHASIAGVPKYLPSGMGLLLEKEVESLEKVTKNPARPMIVVVGGTKVETKSDFLDEMSAIADAVLTGNPVYNEIEGKGLRFRGSEKIIGPRDGIPSTEQALDIGPETAKLYAENIARAKTVFWAGPLGKIEEEKYEKGSLAIAEAILKSGAFSVAGGGDLTSFLHKHNLREKFSHVSTGGGAMLAFLSGESLPGLEALEK